jgi:hypothetical protein
MTRLQMFFRQRIKKHKHDTLIKIFCQQIKHRLFKTRKRRRQRTRKTSIEKKIDSTLTMYVKLSVKKRKKCRFFEQIFYQAIFDRMKKHVKRVLNEMSMQSLRDLDEIYHAQKNEIA